MDAAFSLADLPLLPTARQQIGEFFKSVQPRPKSTHPPPFLQTEGNASFNADNELFGLPLDPRDLFNHERLVGASTPKTYSKTAGRNNDLFGVEASGILPVTPVTHAVTPHFEFATTPAPHQVLPDTDTEQNTHDENNITAININYPNPNNTNREETNNPTTMERITPAPKPTRPLNFRVNQLRGYTPSGFTQNGYTPGSYIDPYSPGSMVSELSHNRTPGPPVTAETPADLRNIRQTLAHRVPSTFLPSYDDEGNASSERRQMELLVDSPKQSALVRSEPPMPAPRIPAMPLVVGTAATADVSDELEAMKNQMDGALREITLRSSDAAEKRSQALRRNQELIELAATQATEIKELEQTIEEVRKKYEETREQLELKSAAHEEAMRLWQRHPQEGDTEELEETVRHLRSELSTLRQDNEDIRLHRHAEHYERQLTREELQRVQKELAEQERLIQGFQTENERLTRQNRDLADRVREAERKVSGKQQDLKEEVANLKAQLTEEQARARRGEETQRELEEVKVEMETLKAEMRERQREQAGMVSGLERELTEAKARLRGEDRAGVEEERDKVRQLEQGIEELAREHDLRVNELERMKEERKEWEEALSKVKRQTGTGAGTETGLAELMATEVEVTRLQEQVEELVKAMGVVEGVVAGRSKRVKALLEDLRARKVLPPSNAPPGTASRRHQLSTWSEIPLSEVGDEDPLWADSRQVRELRQQLERAEAEGVGALARLRHDHEAEVKRLRTRCNELQLRLDEAAAVAIATPEERRGSSDRQGEIDNLKARLAEAEDALHSKNNDVRHYQRLYLDAAGGHRATPDADKQRQQQLSETHVPGVDDVLNSAELRAHLAATQARVVLEERKVAALVKEKLALTNAHEQETKQLKVQVQHLQEQLAREQRKRVAVGGGASVAARDRSPGKDRDIANQSAGGVAATPTKGGAEVRQLKAKVTRLEAETKELQQKVARNEAVRLMIGEDVIGRILAEKNPGPDGEKRRRRSKPDGANGATGGEPDLDVAIVDLIGSGDVGGKENVVSAEREALYTDLRAKEQTPGLRRSVTAGGTKRTGSAITTDKAKPPVVAQRDHALGQDDDPTMVLLNLISRLCTENSALRSRAADARGEEEEASYVTDGAGGGGDYAALTRYISTLTAYIRGMEERFTRREAELSRMVEEARLSGREELDGWKRRWESVVENKFKHGEHFREEVGKAVREMERVVAGEEAMKRQLERQPEREIEVRGGRREE